MDDIMLLNSLHQYTIFVNTFLSTPQVISIVYASI